MTDTPRSQADLRHDRLLEIVQGLARLTFPQGKPDGSLLSNGEKRLVSPHESGSQWWTRMLSLAGIDAFGPDSEDLRFRELLRVWAHCIEKQAERHAAWAGKIEEWYPEREEIQV